MGNLMRYVFIVGGLLAVSLIVAAAVGFSWSQRPPILRANEDPRRVGPLELSFFDPAVSPPTARVKSPELGLALFAKNVSENKRITLAKAVPAENHITDEHGNAYQVRRIETRERNNTIAPGERAQIVVLCEAPIKEANQLDFDLAGDAIGLAGERIRLRVTREEWERGSKNVPQ